MSNKEIYREIAAMAFETQVRMLDVDTDNIVSAEREIITTLEETLATLLENAKEAEDLVDDTVYSSMNELFEAVKFGKLTIEDAVNIAHANDYFAELGETE